jgi:CheY-like chemotaxis protein
MPGGGALELLGRLRGIPHAAGVPVIVATGSIEESSYRNLRDAGALAVIPKSARPEEFARVVGAVLGAAGA